MTDHNKTEFKSQSVRTIVYVLIAAASVGIGISTYRSNQPAKMAEFERVGEEFYPDFNNPNDATSLKVTTFDEDQATIQSFEVEQVDGVWRIPTHYDYPADATEQLAKTASSIIGIKRGALISRRESDHAEFDVADPLSLDGQILKGRGDRITIKNGDTVLADYILGKAYPEQEGAFYVRAPGEKETYVAKFSVDLTTKFQDWIDVDLLKIERDTLTEIIVNKYTLDEEEGRLKDVEEIEISREKFGTPWDIKDLDVEKEEVNSDAVKDLVSALVDTKIIGVRPKPEGLTPSLSVTAEAARNPLLIANIRADMADKGFFLVSREENQIGIIAKEGSFYAASNEGLVYELHFGEVFTGDLRTIELGQSSEEEDSTDESADSEADGSTSQDELQSRYLFVKVNFEAGYLGAEPTLPEAPKEPTPADLNLPLQAPRPGATDLDPQAMYEFALQQYENAKTKYETDSKEYEEKLKQGIEKADELNARLGAWYYVVPAENIEALRATRDSLLQPAGTDASNEQNSANPPLGGLPPGVQLPNLPPGLNLPKN